MKQILTLLLLFATAILMAQTDKRENAYYNQTKHFFDNIDFKDGHLLNTPILEQRMGFYFRQIVPSVVDSVKLKITDVLAKTKASEEVYNWSVRYLYQLYRESPMQGNSEVYNFIGEQFILKEPNRWKDKAYVEKVKERVAKANLNPIGLPATNLKLQTPNGIMQDLYNIKASKTILYFFNPGCEACNTVTEKLFKLYQQYKTRGIQVFAVYTDRNKEEWQNYISVKKLNWINVFDPTGQEGIDQKFDIYAIPMIYVLNKGKKVVAKDVPLEKLENYFTN